MARPYTILSAACQTHTVYIQLDGGKQAGREGAGKERGRMKGGRELGRVERGRVEEGNERRKDGTSQGQSEGERGGRKRAEEGGSEEGREQRSDGDEHGREQRRIE